LRNQGRNTLAHAITPLSTPGVYHRGSRTHPSVCRHGPYGRASDPNAMPLDKFIAEVMHILTTQPMAVEICVESVKRLRFAAESGHYDSVFRGLNDALANASH